MYKAFSGTTLLWAAKGDILTMCTFTYCNILDIQGLAQLPLDYLESVSIKDRAKATKEPNMNTIQYLEGGHLQRLTED